MFSQPHLSHFITRLQCRGGVLVLGMLCVPLPCALPALPVCSAALWFQLAQHQAGPLPLPSALSPSSTLASRWADLGAGDGGQEGPFTGERLCSLHPPGAPPLHSLAWDLQHPCLGVLLPAFPASSQPHEVQALPTAWAAIPAGSSLLRSPPHGAAFWTVFWHCACHGSAGV